MKIGGIINPFLLLSIAIVLVAQIYDWGWSVLFPNLMASTYVFIGLYSLALLFIGCILSKKKVIVYQCISKKYLSRHNPILVLLFVVLLFILNVGYSGSIPFLTGNIDDYESFGMPFVDPLILSLIIFYSIFWFHAYLSTKEIKYLLSILFMLIMCVLMARRALLIYVCVAMLCIYLQAKMRIKVYALIVIMVMLVGLAYMFGKLGEAKSGLPASYAVKHLGGSSRFADLDIPGEFYIPYLYAVSPLANLQLTLNEPVKNDESLVGLILTEYVPDFVSNKIKPLIGFENYPENGMEQVTSVLNVGTYYVGGYVTYGWVGMAISCFYLIVFALFVYRFYPRHSVYHVTLNAFLCSVFLMTLFSNIVRIFSVYFVFLLPLLVNVIHNYRFKLNVKK